MPNGIQSCQLQPARGVRMTKGGGVKLWKANNGATQTRIHTPGSARESPITNQLPLFAWGTKCVFATTCRVGLDGQVCAKAALSVAKPPHR